MPSQRLFFIFALLAAVALAAPSQVRRLGLQKRTFTVPRQLNAAHPGPNGPAALRKVFMKYGFVVKDDFVGAIKATAASNSSRAASGNNTGSVAANPGPNAALFLSPVDVGGQTLNLDFDSGSSDLWMFSTQLSKDTIGQHAAFDPTKSATFKNSTGSQWKISYGDGSGAAGTVGTDTVTIGGVQVQGQTVELANQVSQSFVQDTNTDGLVGLAFSKLNTVNDGTKKTPQKTFFDNVMPNLAMPVFTADLAPDGSGAYTFGSIDTSKVVGGQMTWVPVKAETGFWQFPSTKFAVGDKVIQNPKGSDAIADTGTSLLLVDQGVADAYYSMVPGAQLNAQVGGFIYPCKAALPDMSVAIGDYMAKIPGNQLNFATVDAANTTCFGGVQGNQGAGLQIYGDVMFRAQLVAFNGGNQSLGLGQKKTA